MDDITQVDSHNTIKAFVIQSKERIERFLDNWLEPQNHRYVNLMEAMRYSVLNGGKRLRAALVYSVEKELKVPSIVCDHIAAAIEVMHASSLVHDDLPGLDNDDLRRGKPACHIAKGEAMAILAGDALLNLSHYIIASIPEEVLNEKIILSLERLLAEVIGIDGMIGGQAMEFSTDKHPLTLDEIEKLYSLKTGRLLGCALQMAIKASPFYDAYKLEQMEKASYELGLAFQIQDDILDIKGSSDKLGKPQFSDEKNNRCTLLTYLGLEKTEQRLASHQQAVHHYLRETKHTFPLLHQLIDYIMRRDY